MGINLALANFEYLGNFESTKQKSEEFMNIDSFVPLESKFKIEVDRNYSDIRVATKIHQERIFGDFQDILVELNGNSIKAKVLEYQQIDNYKLVFI